MKFSRSLLKIFSSMKRTLLSRGSIPRHPVYVDPYHADVNTTGLSLWSRQNADLLIPPYFIAPAAITEHLQQTPHQHDGGFCHASDGGA